MNNEINEFDGRSTRREYKIATKETEVTVGLRVPFAE